MGLIASSTALSACDLVTRVSTEIWGHMKMAYDLKISLHEPTITQLLGLDLARFGRGWSSVELPSQRQEAKTGADIYLVVQDHRRRRVVLLLQAKRLDVDALVYRYFRMAQADRLIDTANGEDPFDWGVRAIPGYLCYNYWSGRNLPRRPGLTPTPGCKGRACSAPKEWFGCTFAYADKLLELAVNVLHPNQLEHIETISFPFRCLFCCSHGRNSSITENLVAGYLEAIEPPDSAVASVDTQRTSLQPEAFFANADEDLSHSLTTAVRKYPEKFKRTAAIWVYDQTRE